MRRKFIEVLRAEKYSNEWPPESLMEFAAWATKQLLAIPQEYRSTATIEFAAYEDYGSTMPTVEIRYDRPMTDEEIVNEASENEQRLYRETQLLRVRLEEMEARQKAFREKGRE